jgi:uncharacterized protein YbjT (DUF2867 family)
MTNKPPILVTSAGGQPGSVGRSIVKGLLERGLRVRAFVRAEDERAANLRQMGAEIFVAIVRPQTSMELAMRHYSTRQVVTACA